MCVCVLQCSHVHFSVVHLPHSGVLVQTRVRRSGCNPRTVLDVDSCYGRSSGVHMRSPYRKHTLFLQVEKPSASHALCHSVTSMSVSEFASIGRVLMLKRVDVGNEIYAWVSVDEGTVTRPSYACMYAYYMPHTLAIQCM